MFNKIRNYIGEFISDEPIIRFASVAGHPYVSDVTNIKLAKDVIPDFVKLQKGKPPSEKFLNCPGMSDFLRAGYIIPAWTDFEIKANRSGTFIKQLEDYTNTGLNQKLSFKLVDGLVPLNEVPGTVNKIPIPWAVFTKRGWSAYVIPAHYHSPFLKYLYMYPGIIDHDKFSQLNWVFSAMQSCEIQVPAGTPLLQIIPFKREIVTGISMRGTDYHHDFHKYGYPSKWRSAYRRLFHQKKEFKLETKK
jgi:hypothetical protein